ncbi:MAG: right-handed parallel beta-helix repeat-containing protein [Planctomycetota bacterium]|jgi:hypothetical protein
MPSKSNRPAFLATSALLVSALCVVAAAKTIYVDNDGQADFDNIQAGIDAALDGDTVLVAPGEYAITVPITFRGKAITVQSEAGRDETTIRMGTPADTNRASVVIFENNESATSVLDGFTITGGRGIFVPSDSAWAGGGVFFDVSSGTLRNCAIVQNRAKDFGGGVVVSSGSSLTLTNCIIRGNTCTASINAGGGGACSYQNSSLTMTDCTIAENSAGHVGGGVFTWDGCSTTLTNCVIMENSAGHAGGGLYFGQNSSATVTDCTIIENSALNGGGGIICYGKSLATLIKCVIARNSAMWGGGVMCERDSFATVANCIISRNSARWGGGLQSCLNSSLTLTNCTIWGNSADQSGGGVECFDGFSVAVTNSIVSGNTAPQGHEISLRLAASTLTIDYSDVDGGQAGSNVESGCTLDWGEGNIEADPCFADPNNDDFHLKSEVGRWDPNSQTWVPDDVTSPCIDAGDPNSDWTGEIWPHGRRINMGAYGGTREASMSPQPQEMSLPHIAYIHERKVEAAESFRSLLVSYGCSATLIGLDEVATTPLDSYDLVIVGNDTGSLSHWGDAESVAAIEGSGKPILGLGEGGYAFFGKLGLEIGWPNGMHGSRDSIEVIDPNNSLFNVPYAIDVPDDRVLQLYTETEHVDLHLWPMPETVTALGRQVKGHGYYPLALEHDRFVLWGFTASPENMTQVGKTLFVNVVIRAANVAW